MSHENNTSESELGLLQACSKGRGAPRCHLNRGSHHHTPLINAMM